MANQQHLDLLKQSVETWYQWRKEHADVRPDLSGADLRQANLRGANLSNVNLSAADLIGANLYEADLSGADLSGAELWAADLYEADLRRANLSNTNLSAADLIGANLRQANLSNANLRRADLVRANLRQANLSGTDLSGLNLSEMDLSGTNLSGANLTRAILVKTNLENANLTGCAIHGISVWNVQLNNATQSNLIITEKDEPTITVDNLDVAQFIYLLLNNENIRRVIDTITYKVVLILGRFTPERKEVLDAIRDELRKRNYLPVLFDFDPPHNRDVAETIFTLAHLARFVIADITEPKSIIQELTMIVPHLPSVPILPLLHVSDREWGMYGHFERYPWVMEAYRYEKTDDLLQSIPEHIILPAEQKAKELAPKQSEN